MDMGIVNAGMLSIYDDLDETLREQSRTSSWIVAMMQPPAPEIAPNYAGNKAETEVQTQAENSRSMSASRSWSRALMPMYWKTLKKPCSS